MDRPSRLRRRLAWLLAAAAAAGVVLAVWLGRRHTPPPADPFPIPPYSQTRFLNTGPEAHYIGSAACAGCHRKNEESYRLTPHSRALAEVDPDAEPPDASFEHPLSGRSYRVYRKDGRLRHQEVIRNEAGAEVARVDLPVRYVVGSGHFSRTYLVVSDGFLHESPITWYASRKAWGMSPGYDAPAHASFERPVGRECLSCHAGRAEMVGESQRVTFHEQAIGCESCHGPGSLHEEARRRDKLPAGQDDPTIVHPGKLSRPLREAICAACHLAGPATVALRGRADFDFRPGRPLGDYRMTYLFRGPKGQMTVVGHVEQLRQSACYQKSDGLSCVTCHDPHRREVPKDPAAFYRQKCLACHESHPCSVPEAERRKRDAADSCTACHMPRGDTEIPHIAFTQHRIARPGSSPAEAPIAAPELVPADDDSGLSPLDRRRNLGLAYVQAAQKSRRAPYADEFLRRGRDDLEAVRAAGLADADTALALADVYLADNPDRARACGREALAAGPSPDVRVQAVSRLAALDMQDGRFESAAGSLEELVRDRQLAGDWRLLGLAYLRLGRPADALPALQTALTIRPSHPDNHAALAEVYARLGDRRRAEEHRQIARWLIDHHQE